ANPEILIPRHLIEHVYDGVVFLGRRTECKEVDRSDLVIPIVGPGQQFSSLFDRPHRQRTPDRLAHNLSPRPSDDQVRETDDWGPDVDDKCLAIIGIPLVSYVVVALSTNRQQPPSGPRAKTG